MSYIRFVFVFNINLIDALFL